MQVCDAFDCMISGMECKRISVQQALETMIEAADLLFERKIVKVLQKIVAYYPVGTKIRLNTGETGIVVCQTDNSIRPVVAVLDQDNQMTEIRYDLAKIKNINSAVGLRMEISVKISFSHARFVLTHKLEMRKNSARMEINMHKF